MDASKTGHSLRAPSPEPKPSLDLPAPGDQGSIQAQFYLRPMYKGEGERLGPTASEYDKTDYDKRRRRDKCSE